MDVELLTGLTGQTRRLWEQLLLRSGLKADTCSDSTALIWESGSLIAAGSRLGNLLKCIAVDSAYRGQDLTATLLTQLRRDALQAGYTHLFLYTKPENLQQFSSLFFYPIAATDDVMLMENRPDGISSFLDTLPPAVSGVNGAIVMNANPFTLGHRYLIETAARECDRLYVFVLSEDRSCFSAADRMEMVRLGTSDLQNVTVLPTGPYLISSATFPTYFLKENASPSDVQCRLDTAIFTKYYAPRLSITRRYVGTEPHCPVTKSYNRVMAQLLPAAGITFIEVPRLEMQNAPISASSVRELLTQHKDIRPLVPDSTYQYLLSHHFL